jgi:hypothetical protein
MHSTNNLLCVSEIYNIQLSGELIQQFGDPKGLTKSIFAWLSYLRSNKKMLIGNELACLRTGLHIHSVTVGATKISAARCWVDKGHSYC